MDKDAAAAIAIAVERPSSARVEGRPRISSVANLSIEKRRQIRQGFNSHSRRLARATSEAAFSLIALFGGSAPVSDGRRKQAAYSTSGHVAAPEVRDAGRRKEGGNVVTVQSRRDVKVRLSATTGGDRRYVYSILRLSSRAKRIRLRHSRTANYIDAPSGASFREGLGGRGFLNSRRVRN